MLSFLAGIQPELALFFLGSTTIMLIFALMQWVQIRDRSLLIYAFACLIMTAFFFRNSEAVLPVCEQFGISKADLWRYSENSLVITMYLSYLLFVYQFLKFPKHFSRPLLLPIHASFGIFLFVLVLDWYFLFLAGDLDKGAEIRWYSLIIILIPQYYVVWLGLKLKDIVSRIVITGLIIGMVTLHLVSFGLSMENQTLTIFPDRAVDTPAYEATVLIMQCSLFLEAVCILYAFVYRIRIFQNERDKAYRELWLKQQESIHLKELETQKDHFFTNISHEFRAPLTVILGSAEQLAGPSMLKRRIERNSRQLLRMVDQILELSKLREGKRQPQWVQADVIAYLKFLADPFRSLAISRKQTFIFHAEIPRLQMDFDIDMLQSVFSNLVSNALKFTPEYGEVKVIARQSTQHFILEVIDTGPGIPQEICGRIFERFYTSPPEEREYRSTGIGLWLVRELITLWKGDISVESRPGTGSTFTARLPISREATPADIARPDVALVDLPPTGSFGERTRPYEKDDRPAILIVEDNPDIIAYLQETLEDRYQTHYARHGKEAMDRIRQHRIDLVLCDLMMPEMDGMEMCRALRRDPVFRRLPLIMVTGKATKADRIRGLEAGVDAYLTKPFDRQELLLLINNLLRTCRQNERREADDQLSAFRKTLDAAIEANLDNELFNVSFLCRAMHLARPTLNKKVKEATGQPPGEYLRRKRLQHARRLLETTGLQVIEVAQETGFKTPSHFSTVFKTHFGMSPGETRK